MHVLLSLLHPRLLAVLWARRGLQGWVAGAQGCVGGAEHRMPASQARLPFLWQPQPIPSFNMLQGFLAEGLQHTSAGLGSVVIDSQPLTVALLAALLYGERLTALGYAGLPLGVLGLALLEIPPSLWASSGGDSLDAAAAADAALGPALMLLAAQSMAVGTIMMRWVASKADPVVATGWHMILGGLPLAALALAREGGDLPARLIAATREGGGQDFLRGAGGCVRVYARGSGGAAMYRHSPDR